jgi:DNA topoisomerase 2-associated protein PAT1
MSMNNNNNNNRNKNRNRRVSKHPYFLESLQNKDMDPANDKLAGMMTDKEKNWVVNVQMLQLQIDDPYSYDYYYTVKIQLSFYFIIKLT